MRDGDSRITQDALTRDHTEKMLAAFGAQISVEPLPDGGEAIMSPAGAAT